MHKAKSLAGNACERYFDGAYLAHNATWHAEHEPATAARYVDYVSRVTCASAHLRGHRPHHA